MCRVMEEMRNEAVMHDRIERALNMIAKNKLSLEDIAEYAGLSLEKVRELAESKSA